MAADREHGHANDVPSPKGRRGLSPFLLLMAILFSIFIPELEDGGWPWLHLANRVVAAICVCSLIHAFEYSIHRRFRRFRTAIRLMIQLTLIVTVLGAGLAAVYLIGVPLRSIGDGSTALIAIVCGSLWLLSSSMGSLLVIILERVIRPFFQDFKSRMNAAMLALVGMTAFLAYWAASVGYESLQTTEPSLPTIFHLDLGFGSVWTLDPAQIKIWAESKAFMAQTYFAFFVMLATPAVMSASAKMSDALMSNLDPLRRGFEAVARGELDFRIPERGTADFSRLNKTFNQMVKSLNLAKRMEHAFGAYVSEEILEQIRNQHGEANLEPTLRMATVFFADIRGFTSMSERINPKQLLAVLNRFYEEVASVVHAHQGFLVQYIGDAVVVVFNGPLDQPNHADMAAACAVDVQKAVAKLNEQKLFPESGDLAIGIGVATGPMVAGNLGDSAHLLQYTVLGDTVNQASRLTGLTPPGAVYVNQRNAEMIDPSHDPITLDAVKVKGRARKLVPHQIWPRNEYTDVTEVHTKNLSSLPIGEA
jgi:class 3 adenylate cyclase